MKFDYEIESYDEFLDIMSDVNIVVMFCGEQPNVITKQEAVNKKFDANLEISNKDICYKLIVFIMNKLNKKSLTLNDLENLDTHEFYKENFEVNNNIQAI